MWNRLEARVHQAHGVPLAWLEIMQVVDVNEGVCRVLDIARALSITVGGASKVVDRLRLPVCVVGNPTRPMVDRT